MLCLALTRPSLVVREVVGTVGGKPSKGTKKDRRLSGNRKTTKPKKTK